MELSRKERKLQEKFNFFDKRSNMDVNNINNMDTNNASRYCGFMLFVSILSLPYIGILCGIPMIKIIELICYSLGVTLPAIGILNLMNKKVLQGIACGIVGVLFGLFSLLMT